MNKSRNHRHKKNFFLKFWRRYLMLFALIIALGLGASGLGLAIDHAQQTPVPLRYNFPYLLGKVKNHDLLNELKNLFADNGSRKFSGDILPNQKTLLLPQSLYAQISRIKTTTEKASSSNLFANGLARYVIGLQNTVQFTVTSTTTNLQKNARTVLITVQEQWNKQGNPFYTFTMPAGLIAGVGKATQSLFNGLIAKETALTKWHFSKIFATAKPDGTDADFAWYGDQTNGELFLLNRLQVNKDTLALTLTTASRTTQNLNS